MENRLLKSSSIRPAGKVRDSSGDCQRRIPERFASRLACSAATDEPIGEITPEEAATYAKLDDAPGDLHIEVQKVTHDSRVHLDIETDDIEAEVARLEALGAKRVNHVHTWCVMEAPTGQRFCVVRMKHPERGATPNDW